MSADNVVQLHPSGPKPLPCPFCGSSEWDFTGGESDESVTCQECFAGGPVATVGCRSDEELEGVDIEAEATELWNRRAQRSEAECWDVIERWVATGKGSVASVMGRISGRMVGKDSIRSFPDALARVAEGCREDLG